MIKTFYCAKIDIDPVLCQSENQVSPPPGKDK